MNRAKQRGISLTGWLVILILGGFAASVGFKILPHYMNNRALDKIITNVGPDASSGIVIRNAAEFRSYIDKNMQINSIYDLKTDKIMEIRTEGRDLLVHLNYEAREKILKNIDLVVSFDKEYRVRTQ